MIEFKRNPKTGILEAWKDGKFTGNITTVGDMVPNEKEENADHIKHSTDRTKRGNGKAR